MSVKRKKKKIPSYLLTLRHHGPSHSVLADTFSSLTPSAFQEFLHWNYPRYRQSTIFRGLRTTNCANVGRWAKIDFTSPSEALRWVSAITDQFIEDIIESNQITIKIESAERDFYAIRNFLLDGFSSRPVSLLQISSILFSISRSEGLDRQKKWMNENLFVKSGSFANVLHYFKGVATEGGRDPLDVTDTINETFARRLQDESLSDAIFSIVFGMPMTQESFSNLVQYISHQSSVDQYEAAANLVTSNLVIQPEIPESELVQFQECMSNAGDWRSNSLNFLKQSPMEGSVYLPLHDSNSAPIPPDLTSSHLATLDERDLRTLFADYYFSSPNTPSSYLASSHHSIRQSNTIGEFLQGLSRREVAYAYFHKKNPLDRGRTRVSLNFSSLLEGLTQEVNGLERKELFKLACLVGIAEGKIAEVLCLLYSESKWDRAVIPFFPSATLFMNTNDDQLASCSHDPRIAIALSKIKDALGDEADQIVYLTVEKYLNDQGVSRPSELVITDSIIEDFLYEACVIECLEKSLEFDADADIEEERLSILRSLEALHNGKQKDYEADIHKLVGRQTVNELLQRYEVGKIHCDERAIQTWARDALLAKFIRLRDHIDSGLPPVEHDSAQEFISHISAGKPGAFIFKVPSSEAFNIARSIIEDLLDRYALDPRHGVDSYLSLGMRHGALIDHLRTPLSRHHMVTTKGVLGYEPSQYWKDTFAISGDEEIGCEVSRAIASFSASYDSELKRIKDDLIQVRRAEKPLGIIDLEWGEPEVLSFMSITTKVETFDQLLEEFSNIYWQVADQKLEPARKEIQASVRSSLFRMISELESDLARKTGYTRLGPFTDAAMRAKEELSTALDELASWHNVAKSTEIEPIALVDIISAAKKIVTRLHPEFDPRDSIVGDTHVTLTSSLNVLIEVFKALYTNVHSHSNVEKPYIKVLIDASKLNALKVTFSSVNFHPEVTQVFHRELTHL